MENRFGIKDFFILMIMGLLVVLVLLAMRQFDRQYENVLTIKAQNEQLAADVGRIKRQIADLASTGVPAGTAQPAAPQGRPAGQGAGTAPAPAASRTDAFTHLLAVEKKPDFARGGWFLDNFGSKLGRLTPLVSSDVYAHWVQNLVLESLVVRDPYTLEFVPRIAQSWEVSADGLTMVFHLRDGVTFSDGHPLTAEDVAFTFEWVRNPEVNAPRERAYMTTLKEVKALDARTVRFVFSNAYFMNFETAGTMGIMAKHFYSRFKPAEFNEKTGLLIGSGPYMLENPETWTPGNGVTLHRNPRYWGPQETFDRMVFTEIREEAAEMVLYGNQEHDLIRCTPEMYDKLTADQRIMAFSRKYRYASPYNGYSYIGWNQKRTINGVEKPTPFSNPRVRRAMTQLIDRERLARDIFRGYATVASGPFAPTSPQSDPSIKAWPYDEKQARELLRQAGFEDRNKDGVLEDPDGKPFRFKLTYPGGSEIYEKIILFLRDNFARGGVAMEPERLDWPVLVNRLNQSDFEAVTLGWSGSPESDAYQIFHSSQIKDQGDNRTSHSNPELDKAIENARHTMDVPRRMEYWRQVHRILHEDQPYTFLMNRDSLKLINTRIQGIDNSAIGLNFEYLNGSLIPWYIPRDRQQRAQK